MSEFKSVLSKYPDYAINIGIEVHVQLKTKTKIFCKCKNEIAENPNTNICPICAGHPGTLPTLNKQVVLDAIKMGLATNCQIEEISEFARKHYFYPDLPKGYQISQNDLPICKEGFVEIKLEDGSTKKIRLLRIHIEEDAGKNIHTTISNESFVDLNRAGTPLLESVTYPDITSTYQAKEYLKTLHLIVQYLNICSGNMEEGAFRADTNISVRKKDQEKLGTRCELKNINSFKFISDAIEHEIERQIELLESGRQVIQETRLWNEKENITVAMRSKEHAADYRYFKDPDLPLINATQDLVASIKAQMPELPDAKFKRYLASGLSEYETEIIIGDIELANYYDEALKYTQSKQLINWILRDILGLLKDKKINIIDCNIKPAMLAKLMELLDKKFINNRAAQQVFIEMDQTGQDPEIIVKTNGLEQVNDTGETEKIILELINANPKVVADYKAGNSRMLGFFVGQVMQKTKGKGNPELINELLKKHLG